MDWKILAVVIVATAIVISGLLGSSDMLSGLKDSLGKVFSGFSLSGGNVSRDIYVVGILSVSEGNIKLQPQSLEISTNAPALLLVGNEKIELNQSSVINMNNFTGTAAVDFTKGIDIEGSAETIFISGIGIFPHEQSAIAVRASVSFDSAKFFDATSDKLYLNASGTVGLNGFKMTIKLENETVDVVKYKGQLNITANSVVLEGLAESVSVLGNNSITVK